MLTILEKNNFVNILVVVTRYFGGILLGTGGLVKAYSDVTVKAIESSDIINIESGYEISIEIDYQDIEKFKYFCKINNINIVNEEFSEKVKIIVEISKNNLQTLTEFCNQNMVFSKKIIISEKYIKIS